MVLSIRDNTAGTVQKLTLRDRVQAYISIPLSFMSSQFRVPTLRFETIKIDPLADNGFQLTSIGSDEQFVKGKVVDCKIKFEHPDYYLEDIVHSTDKSLSTE